MSSIIGVQKRGISSRSYGRLDICVVAVLGENKDCACYIGEGNPEWVALEGDKLPLAECCHYFPGFAEQLAAQGLTYRGR